MPRMAMRWCFTIELTLYGKLRRSKVLRGAHALGLGTRMFFRTHVMRKHVYEAMTVDLDPQADRLPKSNPRVV